MSFPNALSYGTRDAARLFHDISSEALLECGMIRSRNAPCFYYQLRGKRDLFLVLKQLDDFEQIATTCADGQAL